MTMYFGTKNISKTKYKIMSRYQYTRIFQMSFNQGGRKKKNHEWHFENDGENVGNNNTMPDN